MPNRLVQRNVELGQLFAQPTDVRGNRAADARERAPVPITLGGQHFDLAAPADQGRQFPALCVWQGPRLRLNKFGEMRQDPSIDSVGLRQPARGARKIPHLTRIDYGDRQPHRGQLTGGGDFVATWLRARRGLHTTSAAA